ncbi:hypothetical protein AVEN_141257-1 [Araneus ventricosus]|uniref:Uncharacterized protein n=1 Tax=Araneus ventricosus TaxID=182803 RepID=A0A4Y2WA00_ARAVE|nr:hypothetical protein AVEN_141257-1 [Araneus ventricosus]
MSLSYHFTKPSAESAQLWWKSLLSNKISRINIAKLISFLTENENLIKQPPNATSSYDTDCSPSPRLQTYGLRPSRVSKPRTQSVLLQVYRCSELLGPVIKLFLLSESFF